MTISYVNFLKHAAKLTGSQSTKSRPVLQGVNHLNSNLIATDSHRLYYAENLYDGSDKNINPKTGELIEGNYPDVTRLLLDPHDATFTVPLDINETLKALKVIES